MIFDKIKLPTWMTVPTNIKQGIDHPKIEDEQLHAENYET